MPLSKPMSQVEQGEDDDHHLKVIFQHEILRDDRSIQKNSKGRSLIAAEH